MEENTKIAHAKNMNKFNFNTTVSIPIDTNVNIKTILDVNTYLFDQKVECGNGKAIVSGKIGVKVLYLDLDNMTNAVNDSTSFSETYLDNSLTNDTYLNISNATVVNNILSTDGNLKINCDVNINPVAYLNLSISPTLSMNENLITKKSEFSTCSISQCINTKFEHTTSLETSDSISKILCQNSYFTAEKVTTQNDYAVVEGKLATCVLYETNGDDKVVKELREVTSVKCDVEISGLNSENICDLSFMVDKSKEEITTELEDNSSIITIKNTICVLGVALKTVSIDLVDDLYSTDNDIETTISKREYTKKADTHYVTETVANETPLNADEPAIDEVIANLNQNAEITNTYIKDNSIYLEGVLTSNLTYIDENKELKHKQLELPFIINSKFEASSLGCVHTDVSILDCRVKIKRGTIIDVEYTIHIKLSVYSKETHEMVDSFTIGKQLDLSKYDFQIFIAKPNETMWELCKRIKISPDDIYKYNKDLPLVMNGGEKVIIKR